MLNSCSSGQAGTQDLFSGTAALLAHDGVDAVAAMQYSITDAAAIAFARGFYTALAHGHTVDDATRSGRVEIVGIGHTLEWVTPVLYVRGDATRPYIITGTPALTTPPGAVQETGPARRRQAELTAIYAEARAELRLHHYDTALKLLDDLRTLAPGYRDAAALHKQAEQGRQLAAAYAGARAAEDAEEWNTAISEYTTILEADASYQDTGERREQCLRKQKIADLRAEQRCHAQAQNWQAILDIDSELAALEPTPADPDGLASKARHVLHQADLQRKARKAAEREAAERKAREAAEREAREHLEALGYMTLAAIARRLGLVVPGTRRELIQLLLTQPTELRDSAEKEVRDRAGRKKAAEREAAERKAHEAAEREAAEQAERRAREQAQRKAQEEAERKAQEEASGRRR